MAKVVRRQPLKVAGKVMTATVEAPVAETVSAVPVAVETPVKKVAKIKVEKTPEQLEAEAKVKTAKTNKANALVEKQKANQTAIDGCGYIVGDTARMLSGRDVEITKITKRPSGVHVWWETPKGISAGGDYTTRLAGKVVDGVLVDALTGDIIPVVVKAPKKAKAKKEVVLEVVEASVEEVIEVEEVAETVAEETAE